jgi:hypothetical protein
MAQKEIDGGIREIARLREQCAELDALRHTACDQRDDYKAEVAQQRALIKALLIDDADTEIERLRDELRIARSIVETRWQEIERLRECQQADGWTINQQSKEIERLTAAHDHQHEVAGIMLREAERVQRENARLREIVAILSEGELDGAIER